MKNPFPHYLFLPLLLSSLLLSDTVSATSTTQTLQIAQQPTQLDATRAAAEKALSEGFELYQQGTAESLQQALEKLQIALPLWQKLGDKSNEALTLVWLGFVYNTLGEKQKALSYFNQALTLDRAVGDRAGEANTLNNIGAVYDDLGEKQPALSYYNQALPLWRAVGDRAGEAKTLTNIGGVYDNLGEKQKALSYYNQALPLWRAVSDHTGEAKTLTNIGGVYDNLGEKQPALSYYNQALPLWRAVGDHTGEARTLNNIGLVYSELGEKQQALSYYNQALPLWRAVGNRAGEARTLNNIGGVYDDLEEKQKALSFFNQALPLYRAVGDRSGEATTLNNIGLVYSELGEKQKALSSYNQALPLYRVVGDSSGEANTLNNIGAVYSNLGEKQQALSFFNQALPLYHKVGDRSGEATTLNNIGLVYSELGEKQKALSYYNQALPLYRVVGDSSGEANTLNNIGAVYSNLGEKQQALSFFNQALPLYHKVGDRSGEATTLNNIGLVYSELGEKQKALSYYNQALPLYRVVGDSSGEANTLNNIGAVYSNLGEKQQALSFFNQALPLSRAVSDRVGEARTVNNIGLVYSELGEKQKALSYYNQALPLWRAVGDRSGEAATLNNIGGVYDDLGEKHKALEFANQALPLSRAVGDRAGEALTLYNIAYLEQDKGNLQTALTQIEASIKIVEELRTKIDSKELRTSYFATVQNYYQFYIDLLMQLHKKEPSKGYAAQALHISERSRARGLVELLTEANIDIRKNITPELAAEEKRLQLLREAKEKQLSLFASLPQPAAELIAATKKEIEDILKQQQELTNKIRVTNPEYAALKYPQPLTLPQIQQQLDKDTLLLQYSIGEERSYLWAVTPNSFNSYELPGRDKIAQAVKNYKEPLLFCQNRDCQSLSSQQQAKFFQAATQLSQLILAPVADKLADKRLVIVGDGALQDIPFAALVAPNTPATNQKDYQPLILKHEIVNLPSMTAIATHRQKLRQRQLAPKTLAVLANPVFSADDERVTGKPAGVTSDLDIRGQLEQSALKRAARNINRSQWWDALPGTQKEAEAILPLAPSDSRLLAVNFDANYNWATSKQLAQYRFVHLATHGFADPTNPELSGIVLSLVNKQGQSIPGYLRLSDIFNLNLPAQLVVLSACETGLGADIKGEGLVGLTRGLMYAGSASVALSLWQVSDEATPELMKEFYQQMLQGKKSPNAALRAAQIAMLQNPDWRYPYYWGAFTVQGEWR
ncbi:CHAT domain-containing tetratricopeptide repeat protein [Nostoc sp. FACHB-280]|uniref:CHAT domain-containing protein n=1 Tax=Nostoc sp. FACHB-280 TaxID=2692839 RepID=UPI00168B1CC9|nr:CHAT domain-containing tetratricopeptide repeat protein [Nostoc sp. FACHB-280]MBD2498791.1 tetratricopeptide repeat protein [Nostoc sp. FACHB-280]